MKIMLPGQASPTIAEEDGYSGPGRADLAASAAAVEVQKLLGEDEQEGPRQADWTLGGRAGDRRTPRARALSSKCRFCGEGERSLSGRRRAEVSGARLEPAPAEWKCVAGCGACCLLGTEEERPFLKDLLSEEQLRIFRTLPGEDGWCKHFDFNQRTCSIYDERPDFCRVKTFLCSKAAFFDVDGSDADALGGFCADTCRQSIADVYGHDSEEMERFNVEVPIWSADELEDGGGVPEGWHALDSEEQVERGLSRVKAGKGAERSSLRSFQRVRDEKINAAMRDVHAFADRLLEAFRRYDVEETGELHMRDVRSCLADIGVQPTLPQEKRAIMAMLQGSQRRQGALDYYDIAQLVPRMWEAIALAKRQDLEYWFNRSLDEPAPELDGFEACRSEKGSPAHFWSMAHYAALKLPSTASSAEIRKAYLALAQQLHPDRGGRLASFQEVQEAYHVLGDPERRRIYDAELRGQQEQREQREERQSSRGAKSAARASSSSTHSGAHQWVKKGQREALRWYRMPLPEFLWRVHGAWQRQSGREEAPLDVFTQSLRQRYRSLASGRLLLRTAAHSLDSAANLLARLRRHLERPRARAGAWRPVSFAAADAAPLRRLLRQGRPRARLELRRALGALRLPPVGALRPPVKGKAAMVLAGALAVSGGSSLWLAACRKEAFGFVWLVSARCYFQITAAARRVRPPARMASGVEGVEIQELVLPEVSVYKVLGCESTLAEYNDHSSRFGNPRSDWKAMYTQLMASHALGTVPYRWDQMDSQGSPYRCANLVQVCFLEPLPVVRCSGPFFWDGSVPGEEKAAVLRSALGLSKEPLMAQLGLAQKAVLMEETEGEWELILDHRHLAALPHESCLVATFQRGALPVTATFASRDGERQKYVSDERVLCQLGLGEPSPEVGTGFPGRLIRSFAGRAENVSFAHAAGAHAGCQHLGLNQWSLYGFVGLREGIHLRSAAKERASLSPTPKKVAVPAGCCRNSCYDVQKLRPCLEALGLRIHDEEWPEVEKIFLPICQEMKPKPKRNLEKGLSKLLFDDKALAKRPQTPQPKVSDFELFEQCFFQVQAHITRQRRRMERELCEEHNLTEEQIDEFRSDVVPLDFLFRKFDRRHSKILGEKEVLELLVASGADAQLLRSDLVLAHPAVMARALVALPAALGLLKSGPLRCEDDTLPWLGGVSKDPSRQAKIKAYDDAQDAAARNNVLPKRRGIRLVSYNLHFLRDSQMNPNLDRVLQVLRQLDADILALQEICDRCFGQTFWFFQDLTCHVAQKQRSIAQFDCQLAERRGLLLWPWACCHRVPWQTLNLPVLLVVVLLPASLAVTLTQVESVLWRDAALGVLLCRMHLACLLPPHGLPSSWCRARYSSSPCLAWLRQWPRPVRSACTGRAVQLGLC
ncbi:unnamed protein product [Effrenium voratum]|nr:unnamed protein product [Effrenium voratum]